MDLVSYRKQGVVGVDLASGEKYFYVAIYFYITIGTCGGVPSASLPYLPRPLCFAWNLASMPNATVGKCDGGQMRRWANATVGKCNGVQMQQCAFFCGQMWTKVGKCGQMGTKVGKCNGGQM